jgi:hypothetical protein
MADDSQVLAVMSYRLLLSGNFYYVDATIRYTNEECLLILMEKCNLYVLENRALRINFGPKRKNVTG